MKVLWIGDVVVSTGFSAITHAVCAELHAAGHEVHVLGIQYYGDPHDKPYTIYPAFQPLEGGQDLMGAERLPKLVAKLAPDVVVALQDPWNIPAVTAALATIRDEHRPPLVTYLAVDSLNNDGTPLNGCAAVAVWTEFAQRVLVRGGCDLLPAIIPLGVDHGVFYPEERAVGREALNSMLPEEHKLADEVFVVGCFGRNQARKRLDIALDGFAQFMRSNEADARLLLHIGPTGERGVDVERLVAYHGLHGKVIKPVAPLGKGIPQAALRYLYSACDVYINTAQAEGWALHVLEAMACGVPCIVPDFAGLGREEGWPGEAVLHMNTYDTIPSAPSSSISAGGFRISNGAYTLGAAVGSGALAHNLSKLYVSQSLRLEMRERAIACAEKFSWRLTGEHFRLWLEDIMANWARPMPVQAVEAEGVPV